jgi:hypothetical protein
MRQIEIHNLNLVGLRLKLLFKSLKVINQFPKKLIQEDGKILCFEIHRLIHFTSNTEKVSQHWNKSVVVPIYEKGYQNSEL